MFEDLNAELDWDAENPPWLGMVLIKDAYPSAEGSLFIHHFVSWFLRAQRPVCLVGIENSFEHYASVAKRMGISLANEISEGRFAFIDAFSSPFKGWTAEEPLANQKGVELFQMSQDGSEDPGLELMKAIWKSLQNLQSSANSSGGGPCVVLDGLSAFFCCAQGKADKTGFDFVHHTKVLASDPQLRCSVVMLAQAPPSPLPCPDASISAGEHSADVVLEASPLSSGQSTAVHGQVRVRKQTDSDCVWADTRLLHFKARDNTVAFFHPGTFKA